MNCTIQTRSRQELPREILLPIMNIWMAFMEKVRKKVAIPEGCQISWEIEVDDIHDRLVAYLTVTVSREMFHHYQDQEKVHTEIPFIQIADLIISGESVIWESAGNDDLMEEGITSFDVFANALTAGEAVWPDETQNFVVNSLPALPTTAIK